MSFPARAWPRQLSTKFVLIALTMLLLALLSIGLTMWVTRQLEGGAAAVNEAGRLRMQAWRLVSAWQGGRDPVQVQALVAEVDGALEHHELIKVKIAGSEREARDAMIAELARRAGAALVQRIGHTAILYRPSKDHRRIVLPRS